jgi:hypothetical protein
LPSPLIDERRRNQQRRLRIIHPERDDTGVNVTGQQLVATVRESVSKQKRLNRESQWLVCLQLGERYVERREDPARSGHRVTADMDRWPGIAGDADRDHVEARSGETVCRHSRTTILGDRDNARAISSLDRWPEAGTIQRRLHAVGALGDVGTGHGASAPTVIAAS